MNNEQQQIIDKAYKNYRSKSKDIDLPENLYNNLIDDLNKDAMFPIDNPNRMLSQEEFINKCKTDIEFSEKWGLQIEERELSLEERRKLANYDSVFVSPMTVESWDRNNIPTKQITITYNDKIIESYK